MKQGAGMVNAGTKLFFFNSFFQSIYGCQSKGWYHPYTGSFSPDITYS